MRSGSKPCADELARARGPRRGAAPRSCRARRTPSWRRVADADAARPAAHPRARRPRARRASAASSRARRRGARRRARPRRPSPGRPTSRGRPRRSRRRPGRRRSSTSARCAASGTARARARDATRPRARSALSHVRTAGHASYDAGRATRHARRSPVSLRSEHGRAASRSPTASTMAGRRRRVYKVRRRSDGSILPVLFDEDDLREERRRGTWWVQ